MAIKASEQITLTDITDAYSVILTSETYTFVGNTSGAPSGLSCTTSVVAYCGSTICPKVTISTVQCPTGISAAVSNNGSSSPTIKFTTTSTITSTCEATIPVSIDGVTINKKFSFAVAKQGADGATGAAGKGIKNASVTYQIWKDGTTTPTGTWSTTPPKTTVEQPYLWTKTVLTYTDNTTSTSYSIGSTPEGIVIGGRNLIKNTTPYEALTNSFNCVMTPQIIDEPASMSGKAMKLTCTAATTDGAITSGFYHHTRYMVRKLAMGEQYTWTVFVKASKEFKMSQLGHEQNGTIAPTITTEWQKITHTFTVNRDDRYAFTFYVSTNTPLAVGDEIYWHSLKLELGNKATDWTPAPEDIENDINKVEQQLTPTALITTISSGIGEGNALSTTKFIMDSSGLHIKNGGFDISNNSGTKVLSADSNGNLVITASINAASGKIGKFTLNDGLMYEGQSTYQGMSGQVTEKYYFNISPNSVHKDIGNIERDFVSSWTLPLLKVNTSGENSLEVYPDGFLRSRQIKMGDGVVDGTLYFGSSQYSNSAYINSGGNIWAADTVQAKNFIAANGQGLRVLNSSGTPVTLIYTDTSDNARIPNNPLIVSSSLTVNGSIYGKASCWLSTQYSTGGWIGFYDSYGGTRKGWIGHGSIAGTDFWMQNETNGNTNGVFLDAKVNGNWTRGRFAPGWSNAMALGSSNNRWYRLYSSNSCDTSSDRRLKENIVYIKEAPALFDSTGDNIYERLFKKLKPSTFTLISDKSNKTRIGFIAQDVSEALTELGLQETDMDFIDRSYFKDEETGEEKDEYSLRYEEFIALNTHMIQKLQKLADDQRNIIDVLEEEVSKLKEELSKLKDLVTGLLKSA